MLAGVAALETMQHDAQALEIQVVSAQKADLTRAQPVAIGDQEDSLVARVVSELGEEPACFIRGEEGDRFGLGPGHPSLLLRITLLSNKQP